MSKKANLLFKKIDKISETRLKDITKWNLNGIFTGLNEVFIIQEELLEKQKIEHEIAKPLLVGEDVRKWKLNWSHNYILYTKKIDFQKSKNAYAYLKEHEKELASRVSIKGTGIKWYELSRPRDKSAFEGKKIVTPRLATGNNFALDETGQYYCGDTTYVIVPDESVDIYYLLGLLNSSVLDFYLKQVSPFFMDKYFVYNASYTERFPIVVPKTDEEKAIEIRIGDLVRDILQKVNSQKEVSIQRIAEKYECLRLDDYPSVNLNLSLNELKEIRRKGNFVYLNLIDSIEFKDNSVEKFIVLLLEESRTILEKSKDLRTDISKLKIPKKKEDVEKVTEEYSSVNKNASKTPSDILELEKCLDQEVTKLYGLSNKEKEILSSFS
jgi:hypothetical protein